MLSSNALATCNLSRQERHVDTLSGGRRVAPASRSASDAKYNDKYLTPPEDRGNQISRRGAEPLDQEVDVHCLHVLMREMSRVPLNSVSLAK